jgi:hypothetical protein
MKPPFRSSPPTPGRKAFAPTEEQRRQILTMTGFGMRQEEMCACLKISRPTLEKHFRYELDTGMTEANMRVAQALYTNCTKNMSVQGQIWWTKARMGWKDTSEPAATQMPLMIITGVIRDADFETFGSASHDAPQIGIYTPTRGSAD